MNKNQLHYDFKDVSEILESYALNLDSLSEATLIDLAARLKPVAKHCEAIDKHVKDNIVKKKLGDHNGIVPGHLFKAILKMTPYSRLLQKELREAHPRIADNFTDKGEEPRITYEVR